MAAEVGWASLGIVPTFDRGLDGQLSRGLSPAMDRAGRDQGRRFGLSFGKVAAGAAAGAIGAGFAAFKLGQGAIDQASTLNESLNAVNLTYGDQARAVQRLGREAARSLGLSNSEFNALSVRFSSFAKTVAGGNGGPKVVRTLDDLTTRASDFASVMNLEVNEAAELFQSGLAGETEPLRKYGLDLSAAAVEAHALATGIADSKGELTESEKVQARYSLLMKSTAQTQGDFANTSDELANQQRILSAEWDNARAKLGTALLPIMKDVTGFILDQGIPAFEDFSDWFTDKGLPAIDHFADKARPLAKEVLPALGTSLEVAKDALSAAAPFAKDMVSAFNDMPKWAQTALVGIAGGGLAAKKLGVFDLLGSKGKGGLSGLFSKASPVPVLVVNKGFGADLGVGGSDGKRKRGGVLPFAAGATPLTAPLILGGDSAPGQIERDRTDIDKAYLSLIEKLGESEDDGFFSDNDHRERMWENLIEADRDQIREWRTMLRDEFGFGFAALEKEGLVPPGLSGSADKQRSRAFETTFEVKSKGTDRAEREFAGLLEQRGRLENKPISPELRLLGVGRAKRELNEFERAAQQAAINVQDAVSNALGALSLGKGQSTNYYGPVTYTDDNEGRKRAQQRHQRAQFDGVRVGR